jgi:hypothetical protein
MRRPVDAQQVPDAPFSGRRTGIPSYSTVDLAPPFTINYVCHTNGQPSVQCGATDF